MIIPTNEPVFTSPEPVVRLVKAFNEPFRNFVATAKTCYSAKGLVREEAMANYVPLAKSIYKAGHHTTLQHSHFQFSLENVSRQFIWSFLHSHPFYNSEQVSQRYVSVKPDSFAIPPMPESARDIYIETVHRQVEAYEKLIELLTPTVMQEYLGRFTHADPQDKRVLGTVRRKTQEVARYVLPVATFAYMYHTVSAITLLRYWRLCRQFDTPLEQEIVVGKMVQALIEYDPDFESIVQEPLPIEQTPEYAFFAEHFDGRPELTEQFIEEFDSNMEGRYSRLVDYKASQESVLANSVREVLGLPKSALSDDDAIGLALNPACNKLKGETMNLSTHSKLGRALYHASYTFRKKISHSADSQDQRHRMTPASRPVLARHLTSKPDYITPELIRQLSEAEDLYRQSMQSSWEAMDRLGQLGVKKEFSMYLLPNAVSIRFTESADLLNLQHKLAMRLCYNAQEEIWQASVEEAREVSLVNPRIGRFLLPPCGLRALGETKPICPEGPRFCGERVWLYGLDEYKRII